MRLAWLLPAMVAAYLVGISLAGISNGPCLVPLGSGCADYEMAWVYPGLWHPLIGAFIAAAGATVTAATGRLR